MPTYEYECLKCHKPHEAFQSITAKPLTKCPRCGGRLKRVIGRGSGFLFRGKGFYITDYRSSKYREAQKRDQPPSSSSASSSTPAKPDTPSTKSK